MSDGKILIQSTPISPPPDMASAAPRTPPNVPLPDEWIWEYDIGDWEAHGPCPLCDDSMHVGYDHGAGECGALLGGCGLCECIPTEIALAVLIANGALGGGAAQPPPMEAPSITYRMDADGNVHTSDGVKLTFANMQGDRAYRWIAALQRLAPDGFKTGAECRAWLDAASPNGRMNRREVDDAAPNI